ncbi:MAG: hypothetical protein AB7L13_03840 [Acidimicrobiia bacterium]
MPDLDAAAVVRVLNRHRVDYVVIGGMAALLHDLPVPATEDIDVTASRRRANLERLAQAFEELEAGLYTSEAGGSWFPRVPVENWAQYDTLHLMTRFGAVDIVFAPDGAPGGFGDLKGGSVQLTVEDERVRVVTPATWESLKQASGRAKDLAHLEQYWEWRDRG